MAREAKLLGFVLLLAAIFAVAQASLAAPRHPPTRTSPHGPG